jgi:hypothetical protein
MNWLMLSACIHQNMAKGWDHVCMVGLHILNDAR